jgi:tripeptide aminopeptidase
VRPHPALHLGLVVTSFPPVPRIPADGMDDLLRQIRDDPRVRRAEGSVLAGDATTVAQQVLLTRIPAPPFGEEARGRRMAELMAGEGLEDVTTDGTGNVLGRLRGADGGAPVVLSAHLDTVFSVDTPVTVREDGDRLLGPGISDDGRGLAVLLAVARAVRESGLRPRSPVLFAATVGEEGPGNLRGVRRLFGPDGAGAGAAAFVSLDGAGLDRIVTRGVGSRRFRITVRGAGGHSWVDWGLANPIHALGATVGRLAALELPTDPVGTLTVARWGGGTSINAVPQEAWAEVDTRSESESNLESVEEALRATVTSCVSEAAGYASRGRLSVEVATLGVRPGGATPPESDVVRAAVAATRAVGVEPTLSCSSTDANVPMAAGIPAVTLGGGGEAGLAHTTEEWYRNHRGPEGVVRALYVLLLIAGLVPGA